MTNKQTKELKLLKDRERRFKKMIAARKRVALAKDVLEQVDSGKITPDVYHWAKTDAWKKVRPSNGSDLRVELVKAQKFYACALGSLFLSCVKRGSGAKATGSGTNVAYFTSVRSHLRKFFTERQIEMINSAFIMDPAGNKSFIKDAVRFGKQFTNDKMRLKAIMTNIVDNNGTFTPPQFAS